MADDHKRLLIMRFPSGEEVAMHLSAEDVERFERGEALPYWSGGPDLLAVGS